MSYSPSEDSDSSDSSESSLARLIRTTLSYDTNVMLAAIISLLLVILFVLLLHLYTRWFLVQARRRSRSSVTVPHVLGSRLHQRFTIVDTTSTSTTITNPRNSPGKRGLPFAAIASLPLFVYNFSSGENRDNGLDCTICLSAFEEGEIGRKLPECGHAFHVGCIDMWLYSHSTCPICRATIQCNHIHSHKTDHLEIEIADEEQDSESEEITIDNEEELPPENAITISDQILEHYETADAASENAITSSLIGESIKKFLTGSSSCSSKSGCKIHPSPDVNGDESEA